MGGRACNLLTSVVHLSLTMRSILFFFRTRLIWDIGSYNPFTIVLGEKNGLGSDCRRICPQFCAGYQSTASDGRRHTGLEPNLAGESGVINFRPCPVTAANESITAMTAFTDENFCQIVLQPNKANGHITCIAPCQDLSIKNCQSHCSVSKLKSSVSIKRDEDEFHHCVDLSTYENTSGSWSTRTSFL